MTDLEWLDTATLPTEPFYLRPGVSVDDPPRFYAHLRASLPRPSALRDLADLRHAVEHPGSNEPHAGPVESWNLADARPGWRRREG